MQSKAAKIIFIVLLIVFSGVAYWFYTYGPSAQHDNEIRELYKDYVKTEATIISTNHNGGIGKHSRTIWTIQYKDQNGEFVTSKMNNNEFFGKEKGEKTTIYFDPKKPTVTTSEEQYDEIMK